MELQHLPYEVLYNILHTLVYIDILTLSQVNSTFCTLCTDNNFWKHQFKRYYPMYPKYKSSWYETFKYMTIVSKTFENRRLYINSLTTTYGTVIKTILQQNYDCDNIIIRNTNSTMEVYTPDLHSVNLKYTYSREHGLTPVDIKFLPTQFNLAQLISTGLYVIHSLKSPKSKSYKNVRYEDYCVFLSKQDIQLLKPIPPYMIPKHPTTF